MGKKLLLPLLCLMLGACLNQKDPIIGNEDTPCQAYFGPLFADVMACDDLFGAGKMFADSKAFLDLIPQRDITVILADYENQIDKSSAGLRSFLERNFTCYHYETPYSDSLDIDAHIKQLWKVLRRQPDETPLGTLIPLKHSYQVPGGRFSEIYYWDSYFTMLGLMVDGEEETVRDMVDNFSELISHYGFVPNGNRLYFLGRSQPPFFSYMVELLAEQDKKAPERYFESLEKEYSFWMNGRKLLSEDTLAVNHCVRMPDGEILNRYFDKFDSPRDEMYRNDVQTGKDFLRKHPGASLNQLYQDLRSGAESGWDFSSRWMADAKTLSSIHTTDIVPVDLNCLLYHLESVLAKYGKKLKSNKTDAYKKRAEMRKAAILKYLWNEENSWFMDYDWKRQIQTKNMTIAGAFPLFEDLVPKKQGKRAAETLVHVFLKAGGVVTTTEYSGEQWDAPNGWAPHQWVAYKALCKYNKKKDAKLLKNSWMSMVEQVYASSHKLLEKYDVVNASNTGGGEYANQDGFGWTNGVYRALKRD